MRSFILAAIAASIIGGCAGGFPWQPSPAETALLASRQALDGAAEWYVEACERRVVGLAASESTCTTYREAIGPATHAAHNAALDAVIGARDGNVALALIRSAVTAVDAAARIDGDAGRSERVYLPLAAALVLLERRVEEVLR